MIQKSFLVCALLFLCLTAKAQDYNAYINQYKEIALEEMTRTGIPASIKLAQGILESNCGKSDLACKANNHFGIKCGNDWGGKSFKKEDDDYEEGKLVKSCFREFPSVYDSYVAHSDFLTDPSKSKRYAFLFDYKSTDYKSWAKGLSKAGYATDPKYADRLIDIIEKYHLDELDHETFDPGALADSKSKGLYRPVRYFNNIKYVIAGKSDTPLSLAAQLDMKANQLIKYNDDIKDQQDLLVAGSRVYLQPKRNQFTGHQQYHMIKEGEDVVSLSQKYGIKKSALLKRNGLADGDIPAPNQKLLLKGKLKSQLKLQDPYETPVVKKSTPVKPEVKKEVIAAKSAPVSVPTNTVVKKVAQAQPLLQNDSTIIPQHTVSKGDTLYGIARSYGLSIDELKKMNNLNADTLSIGQKLLIK